MTVEWSLAEGDKWLAQSVGTYEGGGGVQSAGAEAAIASAYYSRGIVQALADAAEEDRINAKLAQEVDDSMSRHPAGSKLAAVPRPPSAFVESRDSLKAMRTPPNPLLPSETPPSEAEPARGYWPPGDLGNTPDGDEG